MRTAGVQGLAPSARRGHAAGVVEGRQLLVHGGFDGSSHLGDAFAFDPTEQLWTRLHVRGEAGPGGPPAGATP